LLLILGVLNGAVLEAFITPRFEQRTYRKHDNAVRSDYSRCVVFDVLNRIGERPRGVSDRDIMARADGRFELLAGHYVFGNSWEKLLADYNLFRGRIWVLVLIVILFAPLWAFWQKHAA
jgi:hypothetical protein